MSRDDALSISNSVQSIFKVVLSEFCLNSGGKCCRTDLGGKMMRGSSSDLESLIQVLKIKDTVFSLTLKRCARLEWMEVQMV